MEEFQLLERQLSHEAGGLSPKPLVSTAISFPQQASASAASVAATEIAATSDITGGYELHESSSSHEGASSKTYTSRMRSSFDAVNEHPTGRPASHQPISTGPVPLEANHQLDAHSMNGTSVHHLQQQHKQQSQQSVTADAVSMGSSNMHELLSSGNEHKAPIWKEQHHEGNPGPAQNAAGSGHPSNASNRASLMHRHEVPAWRQQHFSQHVHGAEPGAHLSSVQDNDAMADGLGVSNWRQHVDWAGPVMHAQPITNAPGFTDQIQSNTSQAAQAQGTDTFGLGNVQDIRPPASSNPDMHQSQIQGAWPREQQAMANWQQEQGCVDAQPQQTDDAHQQQGKVTHGQAGSNQGNIPGASAASEAVWAGDASKSASQVIPSACSSDTFSRSTPDLVVQHDRLVHSHKVCLQAIKETLPTEWPV